MSPIVGVILMLSLEVVAAVGYVQLADKWGGPMDSGLTWEDARARCACDPPADVDGSPCEPVSLPDRFGIAWRCQIKPVLMDPAGAVVS